MLMTSCHGVVICTTVQIFQPTKERVIQMSDMSMTVVGNLTKEPELRYTQSGRPVCSFGLAVNRRYQQNGEWKDADPVFLNASIWGTPGENAAASLHKGDRVMVTGRLEVREYTKQDGSKGTSVDIIVDEIAASMKFATLTVTRTARTSQDMAPRPAAAAPAAAAPQYADEEPF